MQADAVEMVGVVELVDSPGVWGVLVFFDEGDAGVVEKESPLFGSGEVQ